MLKQITNSSSYAANLFCPLFLRKINKNKIESKRKKGKKGEHKRQKWGASLGLFILCASQKHHEHERRINHQRDVRATRIFFAFILLAEEGLELVVEEK